VRYDSFTVDVIVSPARKDKKEMKKAIALGVMASFVMLAGERSAHAESWFQFEAGVGATHYDTQNGRWYQEEMPQNQVSRDNFAFQLGVTGNLIERAKWGIDWHADYVSLGRAAASCMCTPYDQNYNTNTNQYVEKFPAPLAYFTGSGNAQGVELSVEPFYKINSRFRVGLDLGAYVNYWKWTENVDNWALSDSAPTQHLSLSGSGIGVVPVAGLTVSDRNVSLSYRHFFMSLEENGLSVPPVWQGADVIMMTYKF
jgi:hypothetical protein